MNLLYPFLLFWLGTVCGFLCHVVGLRLSREQPGDRLPFRCPQCGRRNQPHPLMRLITHLQNGGACRACRLENPPLYPWVELVTGVLFAVVYLAFGSSWETVAGLLFCAMLVTVSVTDLTGRMIPNWLTLPFLACFLAVRWLLHPVYPYWIHVAGMAAGFLLVYLLAVLTHGVGGGDIKLYAAVGLFLGLPPLLVTAVVASLLGTVYALGLVLVRRKWRGTEIPFAPFIAAGALFAYLRGSGLPGWHGELG